MIFMIVIKFVSLYLKTRLVGQHVKLRWAAQASLMTSGIE